MYPQERFAYHKRPFWPVLCLKRIGLPCCTFVTTIITCSLQIILLSNYSVTYNFSTCRHYLAENHLSFPSAPRWVRHSYLSKRATIDPIHLWVIKDIYHVFSNLNIQSDMTKLQRVKIQFITTRVERVETSYDPSMLTKPMIYQDRDI